MYNHNDCDNGDDSSLFSHEFSKTSIYHFTPIASSSQHFNPFKQSVNATIFESSTLNETQIESVWAKYIKPNETDEGITLTQLSDLALGNSHWSSKAWKHAYSIYHKEMALYNIGLVISQMKKYTKQQIPILVAVIIRREHPRKNSSVTLLLRDETGDMKATVSEELFRKYSLVPNSVIVLRNIQILTITNQVFPKHFIMIYSNCIEAVFAPIVDKESYLKKKEILTGLTQPQTYANKENIDCISSKNILGKNECSNKVGNQKHAQTAIYPIYKIDESQFVCPDLDVDIDLPLNIDTDIPRKKQKLETSLLDELQLSNSGLLNTNESLRTKSNLKSVGNKSEGQQRCITNTCAKSTFDHDIGFNISRNVFDHNLVLKQKKRFKYIKKTNNTPESKVTPILTKASMFEDKQGEGKDLFVREKNKTQSAVENQIVKAVFEDIDVSCFFDDF